MANTSLFQADRSLTPTPRSSKRYARWIIRRPAVHPHRRNDVQCLRAVAVLLVVAFHAGVPVPGGFVGVDVFFVISGFVITAMLLRELTQTGRIGFGCFYARRARRLLPALALVTVVTALLSMVIQPPLGAQQAAAQSGIAASVFAANIQIHQIGTGYFTTAAELNPYLHTWSLSVEEQFYFLFPALLLGAWVLARKFRVRRKALLAVIVAAASVASFIACVALTMRNQDAMSLAFYLSPARVWEFGAGALIAVFATRLSRLRPMSGSLMAFGGVALIAIAAFVIDGASASRIPRITTGGRCCVGDFRRHGEGERCIGGAFVASIGFHRRHLVWLVLVALAGDHLHA